MQTYVDAHSAFVAWLDGTAECDPLTNDVKDYLLSLATCAVGGKCSEKMSLRSMQYRTPLSARDATT
jgi:hypothetical protein